MDDLTKLKGVGKATSKKLAAAGFSSFAALADATSAEDLQKLQEAGFATAEIDAWVKQAAELAAGGSGPNAGAPAAPPAASGQDPVENAVRAAWLVLEDLPEEDARSRFPLLVAAIETWGAAHGTPFAGIRIASMREGFRRCGIAHPKAATDYPAERFTPDELERLLGEPVLTVDLV